MLSYPNFCHQPVARRYRLLSMPILGTSGGFGHYRTLPEIIMAERKRVRRNTLERRCLGKSFKRLFVNAPKGVFKMLEKIKRV